MSVLGILENALAEVDLQPADEATAELARTYARQIDAGTEEISKLGPRLLDCLTALGMTPAARARLLKGDDGEPRTSPLDELRDRRKRRTEAVDPAPPGADTRN